MRLLAIETSTVACSAALSLAGEISERYEVAPRRHADLLLGMIEALLDESGLGAGDLDAIAFARGPGAFTGVRIAAGVAQGIGFGAGIPVLPVSTLAALAQSVIDEGRHRRVAAAMDARIGEVYWGAFEAGADGLARPVGVEAVCPPDRVPVPPGGGWFGVGDGWAAYAGRLEACLGAAITGMDGARLPRAREVALLGARAFAAGERLRPEAALPVYLRDQVAKRPPPRAPDPANLPEGEP